MPHINCSPLVIDGIIEYKDVSQILDDADHKKKLINYAYKNNWAKEETRRDTIKKQKFMLYNIVLKSEQE